MAEKILIPSTSTMYTAYVSDEKCGICATSRCRAILERVHSCKTRPQGVPYAAPQSMLGSFNIPSVTEDSVMCSNLGNYEPCRNRVDSVGATVMAVLHGASHTNMVVHLTCDGSPTPHSLLDYSYGVRDFPVCIVVHRGRAKERKGELRVYTNTCRRHTYV